ncbi:MAG: hypothetical protein M1834_003283 [Cirrosporium novae-zelandiae]|nr:MAG: hypothetical protein M1834_003283 [Cirrosporium novae-zelandiae]
MKLNPSTLYVKPCISVAKYRLLVPQLTSQFHRPRYLSSSSSDDSFLSDLLSKPTWSARSLLPSSSSSDHDTPTISSRQLHHLLRLSALPPPSTPEEEASMLATLQSQLHFVREIQNIDTKGVEPLRAIRDETSVAQKESEIGLDDEEIKKALEQEEVIGRSRRIRRKNNDDAKFGEKKEAEDWEPLKWPEKKVGRFYIVETSREGE